MAWWLIAIAIGTAGASYIQAKKAQKKAKEMTEGVETNIESNSKEIPVIYGERRVGGTRVYIDTSRDRKHEYLYMVLVMAEGKVTSIDDIKIDDISINDPRFNGVVTSSVHLGDDDQPVSALIKNGTKYDTNEDVWVDPYQQYHDEDDLVPSVVYPWGDKHRLRGVAYLALKFKWDENAFQGIPDVTAIVKGKQVYNPNTGVTEWSDNPALCIRDYLTNTRYGKGLPESAIDDSAFISAMNDLNDFTITPFTGSTTTQKLFTMNHVVDTSKTILDNLNDMLLSCRAFLPYSNGVYSLKIDQPTASVMNIGADQIISGIAISGAKKEDRFNQVKVNFFNKAQNFKEDTAVYPESDTGLYEAYLIEDEGEPLIDEVDCFSINNYYSAREMARLFLERSRQNMTIAFQGTSELINLEVGEVVSVTHPTPEWTNKLFQVQEVALAFDGTVQITCIEYDAALYTYDTPEVEQPFVGSRLPDPTQVDPVTALTTTAGTYLEADGTATGYIDLSWTAPRDSLVDRYEVKFEYSSKEEVIEIASPEYRFKPTQDNVSYVISVRAVNGLGIRSAWLTAAAVTAVVDTTAPSNITGINISSGLQSITLDWTNPSENDFDLVRIKVADTNEEPTLHNFEVRSDSFVHDIGAYSTTKHYWLAPVDRTGNVGNYVSGGSETTGSIDYSEVGNTPTIPQVATTVYLTLDDDNAPTDVEFNTAVGRDPIENDFVVVSYTVETVTNTKAYVYKTVAPATEPDWTEVTEYIDGSMIVTGSLSASDITTGTLNANDVTISNLTVSYDTQVTETPDLSNFITGGDVNANVTSISGGVIQTGTAVTVGTSNNVAILSGADANYRIWAGNVSPTLANFKVHKDGTVSATNAIIEGNITANSLDVEDATITGTLTAPIGWSNSVYSGVINRGNLSESVKDLIDERIAEVSGGISGDFGQDDGSFNLDSQLDDDPQVNNITHESGKNITIELSGSRSWTRTFIGLPVVDMDVSISIQRSLAGADSWSTIATITDTGSSITTSTYLVHSGTQGYSISIYHTIAQDPASGNYDYRAITNDRGLAYNVSIPLQLTVVEPATIGAGNADTLDNQDGTYYLNYNNFTNKPTLITQTDIDNSISSLVDSAPKTLDTLNELAAALGDDANFAQTTATALGTKWTQDNTKISNWDDAYEQQHSWEWKYITYDGSIQVVDNTEAQMLAWYKNYFINISESTLASYPVQYEGHINTYDVDTSGTFGGSLGSHWTAEETYHAHIYTNIYVEKPFTVTNSAFAGDDDHALFINGEFVSGSTSTVQPSYTYSFKKGWYRIDLIFDEQAGGDYIQLGWNPKDYTSYISDMTPYRGGDNPIHLSDKINAVNNSANWDTAYGWGDHSTQGYITSVATPREIAYGNSTISGSNSFRLAGTGIQTRFSLVGYNEQDTEWEWRFTQADDANPVPVNVMTLTPTSSTTANLSVTGTLSASGYNKSNWDTAHGWGDHSGLYINKTRRVACSNAGAGWYRIARSDAGSGRGSFQISFFGYGGTNTPQETIIRGTMGYGETHPRFISIENANSSRATKVRGVQDGSKSFIEVYLPSAFINLGVECSTFGIGNFRVTDTAVLDVATGTESSISPEYDIIYNGKVLIGDTEVDGDVNFTGTITASGYNKTNWDTAYGWGDHASAGYLTSYTESDTLATVTGRGATTSNAVTVGSLTTGTSGDISTGLYANIISYGNVKATNGSFQVGTTTVISNARNATFVDGTFSGEVLQNDIAKGWSRTNTGLSISHSINDTVRLSRTGSGYMGYYLQDVVHKSFHVSFEYKVVSGASHWGLSFNGDASDPINNGLQLILRNLNDVRIQQRINGSQTYPVNSVETTAIDLDSGWHKVDLYYQDGSNKALVYVDGTKFIDSVVTSSFTSGVIGLTIADGSVDFRGLSITDGNVIKDINLLEGFLPSTHDMTLTLSGDATGTATFTDMGNATLSVAVANDSHTHDGRYYTETESDSRFVRADNGVTTNNSNLGLVVSSNMSIDHTGNIISKITNDNSWNGHVYSSTGFTGGCLFRYSPTNTDRRTMVGINSDPTTDPSHTSIDYCFYIQVGGSLIIYESGTGITTGRSYVVGDDLAIIYDNSNIRYYHNNELIRRISTTSGRTFHFDSSFYDVYSNYTNYLVFEPYIERNDLSTLSILGNEVIDSSRNLTSIGNIGASGAVTANGFNISTLGGITQAQGEFGIGSGNVGIHFNNSGGNLLPFNHGTLAFSNGVIDFGHPSYKYRDGFYSGVLHTGSVISGDITSSGRLYFNKDGQTGYQAVIDIDHVENSLWSFRFETSSAGNDNESGFWVGNNGYPDMRLRRDNGTVRALISSWETSFVSNGFSVTGLLAAGLGTSNQQSSVARFGGASQGGEVNALSLVNSVSPEFGNAVSINFHNANVYSPTGKIVTVQRGSAVTDSSVEIHGYNGGLVRQVEIDYLGNLDLQRGGYQVNGTTVIDSSRNLTNIADAYLASGKLQANYYASGAGISSAQLEFITDGKTGWVAGDEFGRIRFYCQDGSGIGARDAAEIRAVNNSGNGSNTTTFEGELEFYTSAYNAQKSLAMRLGGGKEVEFFNNIYMNGTTVIDSSRKIDSSGRLRVSGGNNTDGNAQSSTGAVIGTYVDQYAFIDLASSHANGSWIDFSSTDGGDYKGRIRHNNGTGIFEFHANGSSSANMSVGTSWMEMYGGVRADEYRINTTTVIDASRNATFNSATISGGNLNIRTQNEENPTDAIYLGVNNGNAAGTSNSVGTGLIFAPQYSGYSKRSAGIMQIGEGNYFRSGLAFYTNGTVNATTDWSERMRLDMDGNLIVGQSEVSYISMDNTPVAGSKTNNRLHVNGSIQLTNNDDAIVFGRGTSTFLKDEELGFGWGGGIYMIDGTYLRIRNNKEVYSTGAAQFGSYKVGTTTVIDGSRNLTPNVIDMGSGHAQGYKFHGRGFSWNSSMQTPTNNMPHIWQESYGGWDPVIGIKTTNGFWQTGAYSSNEIHNGYMAGAYGGHSTNAFDTSWSYNPSTFKIGNLGTMSLTVSGNITANGNITAYSDRRLKDNIKTLDGSKVYEMRGVSFTKDGELGSGVIAQELEQVAPELVMTNDDEMQTKSVAYGNVVGYLIEAIKELKQEIEELKNGNHTN